MDVFSTPKTVCRPTSGKRTTSRPSGSNQSETPIRIPESPFMTRLGYGTGVSVYSMSRAGKTGTPTHKSPWAVKKVNRLNKDVLEEYELRINNEAEILKTMSHPNVIGFRALAKTGDGRNCLAMEECQASLSDLIEARSEVGGGPFPLADVVKVGLGIARGLSYLHTTRRILHGDIKSANILIKDDDLLLAKLCDFGVSLPLNASGTFEEAPDGEEGYVGTPCWSAPEVQESASGPVTDKADVFSFGLVLWEMLTLRAPHITLEGEDSDASFDEESFMQRIGTRPPLPRLPASYQPIITIFNACTEHDHTRRPNAASLVDMLQAIQ